MDRDYTYKVLGCVYEVYKVLGPELKSVVEYRKLFEKQLLTYLRLMNCEMGYVINFNTDYLRDSIYPVINDLYHKNSPNLQNSLDKNNP